MPGFARVLVLIGSVCWSSIGLPAELPTPSASLPEGSGPALPGAASPSQTNPPAPPLPGTKTAADTFRELLAMKPDERARVLADRTEHNRKYLEERLREYESLPMEVREARLQQLELSSHLTVLMKLAPTNRAERLKTVPVELRPIIDERLVQWDRLPAKVRQEVMEHDTTANYFLRVRPVPTGTPQSGQNWSNRTVSATPASAPRIKTALRFNQFFGLPVKEQQKTLEALPASEREEMERTLKSFAELPPEQRKICVDSFDKLSRMSKEERDQFLQNAARWKAMSPRERETWRALVEISPPSPAVSALPPTPNAGEP